jgi:hypothetical protein
MAHTRFALRPDAEEISSLGAPFLMRAPEGEDMTPGIGLPDSLVRCWRLGSSDPRDKVFALAHVVTGRGGGSVVSVRPDYRKTVAEVYAEAGRVFLEAKGDQRYPHFGLAIYSTGLKPLDGLQYVQVPRGCEGPGCKQSHPGCNGLRMADPPGLPSWAPNFHWPINTAPLRTVGADASGGRACRIHDDTPHEVLKLDGYKLDTVVEEDASLRNPLCRAVFLWLELVGRMDEVYRPTGGSRVEAFAHTISGGSVKVKEEEQEEKEEEARGFAGVVHDFMLWRVRRAFACRCSATRDDKDTELSTARRLLDRLRPQDHQQQSSSVSSTSTSTSSTSPGDIIESCFLRSDAKLTACAPPDQTLPQLRQGVVRGYIAFHRL